MNSWQITEERFNPIKMHAQESVYTIGNGYFATRGTFEERYFGANPATLLYGVFDDIPIGKEELANVPDWLPIKLFINGERFQLTRGKILEYQRTLDIQRGILTRTIRWESSTRIRLTIQSERFASLADEHIGAIRYRVTIDEKPPEIPHLHVILRATFDLAVSNDDVIHWEPFDQWHEDDLVWFLCQTRHSSVQLLQTMSFTTRTRGFSKEIFDSVTAPSIDLRGELAVGETLSAEKIVVIYTTHDVPDLVLAASRHHHRLPHVNGSAQWSTRDGCLYDVLLAQHEEAWRNYWNTSDILIEGDERAQQAIRYNLYQLRISTNPHASSYSIGAKGLTGFGYHGHVFHDTEIYMLPFFIYVHPEIARTLLIYRYHLLPAAREKAQANGYAGAQYPWESTLDGREATPDVIIHPETKELIPIPNGHIELHITALTAAEAYPHIQVTGIDIDPLMISYARYLAVERARPNIQFRCSSILQPLPFPDEAFDIINARLLCAFMRPSAWMGLLQECKRLLRPGGIICLTEMERSISNSPAQESLNALFTRALRRAGLSFSVDDNFIAIQPQLRRFLRETGIINIQQQATIVDYSHGEPLHPDMTEDLATVFKVAQPFLLKWQVTTQEEIDRLYPQLLEELAAPDFCGIWWYLSAWGQKPQ